MAGKAFKRTTGRDPVWFSLPGKDDVPVRFDCHQTLPGGTILELVAILDGDSNTKEVMAAITSVFSSAIVGEGQYELFDAMTRDPDLEIDLGMMMDVASYLAEQYTAERPTGAPSGATSSKTSPGDDSVDGAPPAPSIYSRSELTAATT